MIVLSLTDEQCLVADHPAETFVEACPGAGKTRTIVARLARLQAVLPPRRGIAVLSFTNSAVEEFIERCHINGVDGVIRHPGFVGTFDHFLRQFFVAPCGIAGVADRPTIVDSWETLGIEVRLGGSSRFRGPGVSLDSFDAETDQIDPDVIGHVGLRANVRENQLAYVQAAARRRRSLRSKGYLSAADVRVEVLQRLQDDDWSTALARALAARFLEVIVDEAQDCNPLDLQILRWLREHGLAVTVVADPDQAIYGFRHGDPTNLQELASSYDPANRLNLTGNFRSSPAICALAATLRDRVAPDDSLGESATIREPVHVLEYRGVSVPDAIGKKFLQLMETSGTETRNGIVVAHARRMAWRASGFGGGSDVGGDSNVANIARAIGAFWSSSASGSKREASLRIVDRMILDLMGKVEGEESPARAAERHAIDYRWLRRTALHLVSRLPRSCEDTDAGRVQWVTTLQREVGQLGLVYREHLSERAYFRRTSTVEWSHHLTGGDIPEIKCATIHEAKGREYEAVCLVIPPDRGGTNRTTQVFDAWERRSNDEAKRVLYVGVTRAKKLLSIAVPTAFKDRLGAILNGAGINFVLHNLASLDATAASPANNC
jgi:DNA helicase-2/ATP-dependent DNA helicase PcrA